MFNMFGKYANATVFTDLCEAQAQAQIQNIINHPIAEGSTIRIMPDVHAGKGCTIGTTMTIVDKVCPNLVGVDIGCGMMVSYLDADSIDFQRLDSIIRERIPSGHNVHKTPTADALGFESRLHDLIAPVDVPYALSSVGTLGGGNHFIEVNKTADGRYVLVIHSGSRHLGVEVAKFYQNKAIESMRSTDAQSLIARLKAEGRHADIQSALVALRSQQANNNKDLAFLTGEDMQAYLHDVKIAQEFAVLSRKVMTDIIVEGMGWNVVESFETIHNYIDTASMVLRKGAVSAQMGEKLIIPMNMRDGSLICVGKGNSDWNCSAPHGAGRLMSRGQAKRQIDMADFVKSMEGIFTTSVCESTLDESPMAYKPMTSILENIGDSVNVIDTIKPVYNYKAN